jgi:hypothetical protein
MGHGTSTTAWYVPPVYARSRNEPEPHRGERISGESFWEMAVRRRLVSSKSDALGRLQPDPPVGRRREGMNVEICVAVVSRCHYG